MDNDNYEYVDINEYLNHIFKQKVTQPTNLLEKLVCQTTKTQIKSLDHIIIVDRY